MSYKFLLFLLVLCAYFFYLWFSLVSREQIAFRPPPTPEGQMSGVENLEADATPLESIQLGLNKPASLVPQPLAGDTLGEDGSGTHDEDLEMRHGSESQNVSIQQRNLFKKSPVRPKNVILLIGDGMGFEHLKASSIYAYGDTGLLFMQSAPSQSIIETENSLGALTDSAAAATAMATGKKVGNGILSLGSAGQPLETSLEFFQKRCKGTGLVATSYLSHATPAAFASHRPNRMMLNQIASDFFAIVRPNVLFGGTQEGITPQLAESNGYSVVTNRAELDGLAVAGSHYVSGQFGYDHMAFEYDGHAGETDFYQAQPHLSEMAQKAIALLSQNPNGFFLMIESSRIDHASHLNAVEQTIFEVLEFDKTVELVVEWALEEGNTLVIVAADHETGGLEVMQNNGADQFPDVSWATIGHTSVPVPAFIWGADDTHVTNVDDNSDIYFLTVDGQSEEVPDECPPLMDFPAASGGRFGEGDSPNSQLFLSVIIVPKP